MDPKRVLLIGVADPKTEMRQADLFSNVNLTEIHTIIWNPSGLTIDLFGVSLVESSGIYDRTTVDLAIDQLKMRMGELLAWVKQGHAFIILARDFPVFYSRIEFGSEVQDIAKIAPISWANPIPKNGSMIEYCGPKEARTQLQYILDNPQYEYILDSADLVPLLTVSTTQPTPAQLVAGYRYLEAVIVVFVPPPGPDTSVRHLGDIVDAAANELPRKFLEELVDLPSRLGRIDPSLPNWTNLFRLPEEAAAHAEIDKLTSEVTVLQESITSYRKAISGAQPVKHLFASSGDQFVDAVKGALHELGLEIIDGPTPRADLLAWDGNQVAVIEAKGLDGPARESNMRQCERWRMDVIATLNSSPEERDAEPDLRRYAAKLSELGVPLDGPDSPTDCKGILIIGTYRKRPLSERMEPDFGDPLTRTISRSPICALTGLQLLGLMLEARLDPERREAIVDSLFATRGVLGDAADWRSFLHTWSENPTEHDGGES